MENNKEFAAKAFMEANITLIITFAYFYFCGINRILAWNNSIRDYVIGALILTVMQMILKQRLFTRIWSSAGLIYLLMMSIYPYVIGHSMVGWNVDFDFINPYYLSALSVGVILTLIAEAGRTCKHYRLGAIILISLVVFYFSVTTVSYLVYFSLYHNMFSTEDMIPVLMTDWQEIKGYLTTQFSFGKLLGLSAVALFLAAVSCFLSYVSTGGGDTSKREEYREFSKNKYKVTAIVLLVIVAGVTIHRWVPRCYPLYEIKMAQRHSNSIAQAKQFHDKNYDSIQFYDTNKMKTPIDGTVILIIGESANRDRMKAFHPSLQEDNTPWLTQMVKENQITLYRKAYSNYPATALSLEQVLTSMNQYHDEKFNEAISIIDVANKAGYDTWWLSNQSRAADGNAVYGIVAEQAKNKLWVDHAPGDDQSLQELMTKIPREGSHFIVIHLYGSHTRYKDRYPKGYEEVRNSTSERIMEYDTSIKYTDEVMSKIFNYAKQNLNLQAMVYTSDHGEDMEKGHGEGGFTYAMVHIPVFFYLSPNYQHAYPEHSANIRKHENDAFTNDLMFDSLCGILLARNNFYSADHDVTDSQYSLPLDQAFTVHGKYKVSDDSEL